MSENVSEFLLEHFYLMPDFITIKTGSYFGDEETYLFNSKTAKEDYKLLDELIEKYGERTVLDFTIRAYKYDLKKTGVSILITEE